jgi:hypothetical protein
MSSNNNNNKRTKVGDGKNDSSSSTSSIVNLTTRVMSPIITTSSSTVLFPIIQRIEIEARESLSEIAKRVGDLDLILEEKFGKTDDPLSSQLTKIQTHYQLQQQEFQNALLASSSNNNSSSSSSFLPAATTSSSTNTPVIILKSNPELFELINFIVEELNWGITRLWKIERWMQLRVPKKEDGGNFGVDVLLECSRVINDRSNLLANYLSDVPNYFFQRGSAFEKLSPKPIQKTVDPTTSQITELKQAFNQGLIEDFLQFLIQLDLREWWSLREVGRAIQDSYLIVFDVIVKNQEKIENPRSGVTHNQMY